MKPQDIISEVVKTEKTAELVRKAIPILIHWAQTKTTGSYKELYNALGYSTFSYIGSVLGYIQDTIDKLVEVSSKKIPSLNALVYKDSTELPSEGFDYVYPNYNTLNPVEKKTFIEGHNQKTFDFPNWNWVLQELSLTPYVGCGNEYIEKTRASIAKGQYGKGGEGAEHKTLKEYVKNNPNSVGIKYAVQAIEEHTLLSADRIDVLFVLKDGAQVAVEVKPSTSPEDDIARGIFQCVKYKAVMDAECKANASFCNNSTLLVIAGAMSAQNKQIAKELNIAYIENFKINK